MQRALLQRYDFTEQGYRKDLRCKPEGQESPGQFIGICNFFNKWVEFSEVQRSFEGVEIDGPSNSPTCPRCVRVLEERKPRNLEELAQMADSI